MNGGCGAGLTRQAPGVDKHLVCRLHEYPKNSADPCGEASSELATAPQWGAFIEAGLPQSVPPQHPVQCTRSISAAAAAWTVLLPCASTRAIRELRSKASDATRRACWNGMEWNGMEWRDRRDTPPTPRATRRRTGYLPPRAASGTPGTARCDCAARGCSLATRRGETARSPPVISEHPPPPARRRVASGSPPPAAPRLLDAPAAPAG